MNLMNLLKSTGLKRKLAAAFAAAALLAGHVPVLLPYQPMLAEIAGWLGAVGYAHAVVSK